MSIQSDPWASALRAVFSKAVTDADFRAKCLSDAPAAFKEISGLDVVGVKFTEGEDGAGIRLPAFGSDPDELTESEILEQVAGGAALNAAFQTLGCN